MFFMDRIEYPDEDSESQRYKMCETMEKPLGIHKGSKLSFLRICGVCFGKYLAVYKVTDAEG